jgi:hypothetical protein
MRNLLVRMDGMFDKIFKALLKVFHHAQNVMEH